MSYPCIRSPVALAVGEEKGVDPPVQGELEALTAPQAVGQVGKSCY